MIARGRRGRCGARPPHCGGGDELRLVLLHLRLAAGGRLTRLDTARHSTQVQSWPTHILVTRKPNGGAGLRKLYLKGEAAVFVGDLPAHHIAMEAAVARLCGRPAPAPAAAAAAAGEIGEVRAGGHGGVVRPEEGWEDVEVFLGREHAFKNGGAEGGGCHDGEPAVSILTSVHIG
jgi:hypothetical protein